MLSLHKKTDQALVALACLAERRISGATDTMSAREIAEKFEFSASHMMQIMKVLQQNHLVSSQRGAHGGYTLARDPDEISLLEIIEKVEGPISISCCCHAHQLHDACNDCNTIASCPISNRLTELNQMLCHWLEQFCLSDLIGSHPLAIKNLSLPLAN